MTLAREKMTAAALIVWAGVAGLGVAAQTPLDPPAVALRSHLALQALDRYLETWNTRNPALWATSLHFPHVRPAAGPFEMSRTPEEYAAGVNFEQTVQTGWHHTEWVSRDVLQLGIDKVHVAGTWQRYTEEGKTLGSSLITYVVTNENNRWGIQARFAAGAGGIDAAAAARNAAAALDAVKAFVQALNSHDPKAVAGSLHYPNVRLADGLVEVWPSAEAFLAGPEPGRQRTWYATRLDRTNVVQVSPNGVNVTIAYSHVGRDGRVQSQDEALLLVTLSGGAWKIQARSSMGV